MKIKCPLCQKEYDDLRKHLIDKALIFDVVDLYLFERQQHENLKQKIHEKIEFYGNTDLTLPHNIGFLRETIEKDLKSLLEDKE